jgi:hypothetical protein
MGSNAVRLVGTTPTANDVFFTAVDRLVGWDTDSLNDIYDARVGGGFPEPISPPPPCEAETCRGGGTVPPAGQGPATSGFAGPPNPAPPSSGCRKGHRRVKAHGRFVCKKAKHRRHQRHHKHHESGKGR